jgi:glycosyltransferase involved in cell wall biosynthesis
MKSVRGLARSLIHQDKLVLTLLVKNEADIIVDNIFYHYARGVDRVIVTDNGSTDGTTEILQQLHDAGIVELLHEKLYNQDLIVNKMGNLAKNKYGATILIHCDADEFWTPLKQPNLKKAFLALGKDAVLVQRYDALPTVKDKYTDFPQKTMNIVTKHLRTDDLKEVTKTTSMFLLWLPPKVMFNVRDKLKEVSFGNHFLMSGESGVVTDDIVIYHFPFKSAERFREKVLIGGQALAAIKTDDETSWHWKRWYKAFNEGKLDKEIDILIPDLSSILGITYEKFNYQDKVIGVIKNNKRLYQRYLEYRS